MPRTGADKRQSDWCGDFFALVSLCPKNKRAVFLACRESCARGDAQGSLDVFILAGSYVGMEFAPSGILKQEVARKQGVATDDGFYGYGLGPGICYLQFFAYRAASGYGTKG